MKKYYFPVGRYGPTPDIVNAKDFWGYAMHLRIIQLRNCLSARRMFHDSVEKVEWDVHISNIIKTIRFCKNRLASYN